MKTTHPNSLSFFKVSRSNLSECQTLFKIFFLSEFLSESFSPWLLSEVTAVGEGERTFRSGRAQIKGVKWRCHNPHLLLGKPQWHTLDEHITECPRVNLWTPGDRAMSGNKFLICWAGEGTEHLQPGFEQFEISTSLGTIAILNPGLARPTLNTLGYNMPSTAGAWLR